MCTSKCFIHPTLKGEAVQEESQAAFRVPTYQGHAPTLSSNARAGGLFIAWILTHFELIYSRFSVDLFIFFQECGGTQRGLRKDVP